MHLPLVLCWPDDGLPQVTADIASAEAAEADQPQLDAEHTRVLLELIHEFSVRGESVATAHNSRNNAATMFEKESAYPRGLKSKDATALLREAERDGLLERQAYRGIDRKPRQRWALTPAGCQRIGVAPSAPSAPSTELGTDGAGDAALARQVRQVGDGGYGGRARTQNLAQKRSKPALKKGTVRKTAKKDSAT